MNNLSQKLPWLGIVPFILTVLLKLLNIHFYGLSGSQLFVVYSGIIVSFMAGALWGVNINRLKPSRKIMVITNLWALVGFLCLLYAFYNSTAVAIIVLIIGYMHLLTEDLKSGLYLPDYLMTRKWVTGAVILLHILMLTLIFLF